jgi:hypothetical protein
MARKRLPAKVGIDSPSFVCILVQGQRKQVFGTDQTIADCPEESRQIKDQPFFASSFLHNATWSGSARQNYRPQTFLYIPDTPKPISSQAQPRSHPLHWIKSSTVRRLAVYKNRWPGRSAAAIPAHPNRDREWT